MLIVRRCLWMLTLLTALASVMTAPVEAQETFPEAVNQWRQVLKDLRELKVRYQAADEAESAEIKKQWADKVAEGERLIPVLRDLGLKAFEEDPNGDRELTKFLVRILTDDVESDRYEEAYALAKRLIELGCDSPQLSNLGGRAAAAVMEFEDCRNWLAMAAEQRSLDDYTKQIRSQLSNYEKLWEAEQEIRKREESMNLPRVLLTTSKGEIELELFENEAPGAVGNFISLVDSGFYDGLTFHRVLKNFMAQGGCPKGDGTGDPGYSIYCECYQDNARKHFRGSLSMANAGRDTGGSQFFITFLPTPTLNGKHTVFGRVVRGFDVLAKIQRRDPESQAEIAPDTIISAKVLRKDPDKEYAPNKVE